MTTPPPIKNRSQLVEDWIRRLVTYTDKVTWFGANSIGLAWAKGTAVLVESTHQHALALHRRVTLAAASEGWLTAVARERGAGRQTQQTAGVMVVVQPVTANVATINIAAAPGFDDLLVDAGADFSAADVIRIRNGDGTTTETAVISSKPAANTIRVPTLSNAYTPGSDDVDVLFRVTLPAGTLLRGPGGGSFATTDALNTSDANAVLDGESTALSLADKVWAESTVRGSGGAIQPLALDRLVIPVTGVKAVFNPAPSVGGTDYEEDPDLRYRAAHWPTMLSQETEAAIQSLANAANSNAIRAINVTSTTVGQMNVSVMHRGGSFSAAQLAAIETFIEDRVRSGLTIAASNVILASVFVEAEVTLSPGSSLETVWRAASSALADLLDARTWAFAKDVSAADLLVAVRTTTGIASVDSSSFLPASDVAVGALALPTLTGLSLRDTGTGDTINAVLAQSW